MQYISPDPSIQDAYHNTSPEIVEESSPVGASRIGHYSPVEDTVQCLIDVLKPWQVV